MNTYGFVLCHRDLVDAFTFKYVICLDFEATCEEGERFSDAAEIIGMYVLSIHMIVFTCEKTVHIS